MFDRTASFICAYCGADNVIEVDISGGMKQEYFEECEICSRSNQISVVFDKKIFKVQVEAVPEA